jgi:hypothetical protein
MSLIAHYTLNGTAKDVFGIHNGTDTNVTWTDGKLVQAGTSSLPLNINSGIITSFTEPNLIGNFSVSFWYKPPTTIPNTWTDIIKKRLNDSVNEFVLRYHTNGTDLQFYYGTGSSAVHVQTFSRISLFPADEWTHVVLLRDFTNNVLQIYRNGQLFRNAAITSMVGVSNTPFTMHFSYDSLMTDVRVYDHVLAKKEIQAISRANVLDVSLQSDLIADSTTLHQLIPSGSASYSSEFEAWNVQGAGSYIDTTYAPFFNSASSDFTIESWYRHTSTTGRRRLFGARDSSKSGNPLIELFGGSTQIQSLIRGANGVRRDILVSVSANDGNFHHIAWVCSSGNSYLYFDGVLVGQNTSGYDVNINLKDVSLPIGATRLENSYSASNEIDMVRSLNVYHTALTDTEIKELYQQKANLDARGNFYSKLISSSIAYQKIWGDGTGIGFTSFGIINSSTNGVLRYTSSNNDPQINMYNLGSFDPNKYKYIQMKYRVVGTTSAGSLEVFFTNERRPSANADQRVADVLNSDGNWNVISLDMSTNVNWTHSDVTGWRLDAGTVLGMTIELEWVRLVSDLGALSVKPTKSVGDFSEIGITNSMTAYLPLKSNTNDYSTNSVSVSANGVSPTFGGLNQKGAYQFTTQQPSNIQITHPAIDFNTTSVTLLGWFSVDSSYDWSNNRIPGIISNGTFAGSFGIGLATTDNRLFYQFRTSTQGFTISNANLTITRGQTFFAALVYDHIDKTMRAHLNDVTESLSADLDGLTSQTVFWLGGNRVLGGPGSHVVFEGTCSEVKIFNRALTQEQIAVEYKRTGPTKMSHHQGTAYIQGEFKEK